LVAAEPATKGVSILPFIHDLLSKIFEMVLNIAPGDKLQGILDSILGLFK